MAMAMAMAKQEIFFSVTEIKQKPVDIWKVRNSKTYWAMEDVNAMGESGREG